MAGRVTESAARRRESKGRIGIGSLGARAQGVDAGSGGTDRAWVDVAATGPEDET
jgi:hypothetical protein